MLSGGEARTQSLVLSHMMDILVFFFTQLFIIGYYQHCFYFFSIRYVYDNITCTRTCSVNI